jgi:hypothetical protein
MQSGKEGIEINILTHTAWREQLVCWPMRAGKAEKRHCQAEGRACRRHTASHSTCINGSKGWDSMGLSYRRGGSPARSTVAAISAQARTTNTSCQLPSGCVIHLNCLPDTDKPTS